MQADVWVQIFRRDHLALLGESFVTIHRFWWLRQDGLIAWAATASDGPAAPMKEPERDPFVFLEISRKLRRRAIKLPVAGKEPPILVAV